MSKGHLSIVGLGVSIPAHVTREASEVLAKSTSIFTVVQEPPTLWLPTDGQHIPVTNLMDMYAESALRADNYERVSERIWNAVQPGTSVAYVTYGNPFAYDSVAQRLANNARAHDVPLRVVPAISSIDTLLCDLRTDMAPGIQIYEASWLVAAQIDLNPAVPAILLQLGAFGSLRAHYRRPPEASALKLLEEHMCRIYPATHEVDLVRSGNQHAASQIRRVALSELTTVRNDDFLGATMFVPPATLVRMNQKVLDRMAQV